MHCSIDVRQETRQQSIIVGELVIIYSPSKLALPYISRLIQFLNTPTFCSTYIFKNGQMITWRSPQRTRRMINLVWGSDLEAELVPYCVSLLEFAGLAH